MTICPTTQQKIWNCPCGVCAPLRRMISAKRRRRAVALAAVPAAVRPGETDRRLKDALSALPPTDRD